MSCDRYWEVKVCNFDKWTHHTFRESYYFLQSSTSSSAKGAEWCEENSEELKRSNQKVKTGEKVQIDIRLTWQREENSKTEKEECYSSTIHWRLKTWCRSYK